MPIWCTLRTDTCASIDGYFSPALARLSASLGLIGHSRCQSTTSGGDQVAHLGFAAVGLVAEGGIFVSLTQIGAAHYRSLHRESWPCARINFSAVEQPVWGGQQIDFPQFTNGLSGVVCTGGVKG